MKPIEYKLGTVGTTVLVALAFFGGMELVIKIAHLFQVHP